ncbi:MAG: TonB-dependent receptor family protein [Gemmatimonadales bacterium]
MLVVLGSRALRGQDTTRAQTPKELPAVTVIGSPDRLRSIPGSGTTLDSRDLRLAQPRTLNEILRVVPGVFVRDEEGLGLRPNLGIRGLNPTRSTGVLLLEDGVPFSLAPYGDNGSYYVPPVDRFEGIEVLKGSGQIAYGPRTIGGVINLLSPRPPLSGHEGRYTVAGGDRSYHLIHLRHGFGAGGKGLLADLLHKRAASGRANLGTTIADATVKGEARLSGSQFITLKGNYYRERSQVTYSGLTEAEFAADPFQNPFASDSMFMDRASALATHQVVLDPSTLVTTKLYASWLWRDWWRQSSNSAERPNDASDPQCGGMANLSTTCGNQGRLRNYRILGVEPRVAIELPGLGEGSRLEAGVRAQFERQLRRQENGATPVARSGVLVEDNVRRNTGLAAFLQPRFRWGEWTVTPGLRVEYVDYERINRLGDGAPRGTTSFTQWIPGAGVTWSPTGRLTVFAGIHRGFAPPRTEDILTNAGGVVDLDAELSWNTEVGLRYQADRGFMAEATAFQLDFSNQIVPASVAGGSGATLTSAGETRHRGLELSTRITTGLFNRSVHQGWLRAAWTWLPIARFEGERFAWIGTGNGDVAGKVYLSQNAAGTRQQIRVTGNRLPYAPVHLLTAAAGYEWRNRAAAQLEAAYAGAQFTDPVNTDVTVPDGQQGPIPGATVWNLSVHYRVSQLRTRFSLAVKNLFDTRYLVDRSRGLMPGSPRLISMGAAVEVPQP